MECQDMKMNLINLWEGEDNLPYRERNMISTLSPTLSYSAGQNSSLMEPVRVLYNNTNTTFAASTFLAPVQLNNHQAFTRLAFPSAKRSAIRSPLIAPTTTNLYNSRNSMKILTLRHGSQTNVGPIYLLKKPSQFLHLGNQKFYTFKGQLRENNKKLNTFALKPLKNIIVIPHVPLLTVNEQKPVSLSEKTHVRGQTNNGITKESDSESEKESSERAAAIKRIVESFEAAEKIIEERNKAKQKGEINQHSLSDTSICTWCADYCPICKNIQ